ncbi:MAG TPA: dihydroneopterin aldolase [Firmicutes bacterium]|nr:dihydroneopterin aldolase [Bacillota bacterium]
MDKIFIRELLVRCIIGINDEERRMTQDVLINIELGTDIREAAQSDKIDYAVDYKALKKKILEAIEKSEYFLIETMAEKIAEICLEDNRVNEVTVRVEKPTALRFAKSVGVEINRKKG